MACTKCAKKAELARNLFLRQQEVLLPQECVFSVEELERKLQDATLAQNWNQVGVLKSALNIYPKSCNMFNSHIK